MKNLILILLLVISAPAYSKEQPKLDKSTPEPKPLVCTEKHQEKCLTYKSAPKLEALNVERVIDGDTIVSSGRKIRLWGINAPEKNKPYHDLATIFLKALLKDGSLECKFLYKDRYQREVMHCWVDKADLGAMIVEAGLAIDYVRYSEGFYYYQERLAKLKKRGMWRNTNYKVGE